MKKLTFAATALSWAFLGTSALAANGSAAPLSPPGTGGAMTMQLARDTQPTHLLPSSRSSSSIRPTVHPRSTSRLRLAEKVNRKSLAKIRAAAISRSMARLEQLRPFTPNFARLKAAVRAYWMRNVHRPHAGKLTQTILRHVSPEHRSLVRDPVYRSALDGTHRVRAALAK